MCGVRLIMCWVGVGNVIVLLVLLCVEMLVWMSGV